MIKGEGMDKRWEKASEEIKSEKKIRPSLTYWQDAWRRLKQNKLSMIGLVVIILLFMTPRHIKVI